MNEGQTKFYEYILERVDDKDRDKAAELLNGSFTKQDQGTFDQQALQEFIPKMFALIKPEYQTEVETVMKNFSQRQK